jgi:hypothetical protein
MCRNGLSAVCKKIRGISCNQGEKHVLQGVSSRMQEFPRIFLHGMKSVCARVWQSYARISAEILAACDEPVAAESP